LSAESSTLDVERSAPKGAVFLSYAREDTDAARRIAEALRSQGVEVWFDQNELRGGDQWDARIRGQIKTCALFVPVISATTRARDEAYFRLEWKLADDRSQLMAPGKSFIVPVVIDHTPETGAGVPESFARAQWTRLASGLPSAAFVDQVKRLLDGGRKAPSADAPASPATATSAAGNGARRTGRWILAGGLVLAAIVALLLRPEKSTPVDAKSVAAAAPVPAPSKPVRVADKSIAVLPFTNMSEDKDNAFFTDGVHEDILTNLALIRELRVVSRTSVQSYRGTAKPMKQIAEELGVTYILEGSVRRSGNKVRVTGQLIHAATDEHVWAQSYDRDLTDVFTIQAELSQQIAGALKAALSPEEKVMIARRPTENPAAYDQFLRARDIRNRESNTRDSFKRRVGLLEKAVELDPGFAQAWGELAVTQAYVAFLNYDGRDGFLAQAKVAIDRAVKMRPDDFEVITSLGTYYYYGYRDYARATEQFERLARLQPNSPVVFNSLALIQRRQGHWGQSLANSRRASELDPANVRYLRTLLATCYAGNHYEDAKAIQQRIVTLLPDQLSEAYELAIISFLASGSTREGDQFFAGLTDEQRTSARGTALRMSWARLRGDLAEAIRLDQQQPYFDEDGTPRWRQAISAAFDRFALGDQAGAIARLGSTPADLRQRLAEEPTNALNWSYLGGVEIILGNKPEALRCLERSAQLLPESVDAIDGVAAACSCAYAYAWLGENERALAEFQRLLRTPYGLNVAIVRTARFPLRSDPRFEALLNDPKNNAPLF
jgi:TolB-like protein/cytochrome c-type biogenesis protein CcmH/NrfG